MNIYLGLFLIAFSGLSLEITLVRLLSVTTWYHLAFFAISTAMLGMTAGATRVFLSPQAFCRENLSRSLWKACIYLTLCIPVTLLLLCLIPLDLRKSVMSLLALLITTVACALPFYFAGTIVSAVLTKHKLPMGKLYASDLIGASMGCLFVLGGLEVFDAPSLILLCSCTSAMAAMCFGWREPSIRFPRLSIALFLSFLLAGLVNSLSPIGIRPLIVKGRIEPASSYLLERWNSFSRVAVYEEKLSPPQYWGPSPFAPEDSILQYRMNIDGEAGTYMRQFNSREDIYHLRYDVTNIAYYLAQRGKALVIGVGGGRDIQSAVLFGQEHVVGIEINPIFVDLLRKDFRVFAGLEDHPDVTLVTAEARGYLSQRREKYSIIQMSLIDTWAATGAGAFSLSENSLYTVEAWALYLNRLEDNGIFTVSRWHSPDRIGETGRVVSLAVAALLGQGVREPSKHIALITAGNISTLIVSRRPFQQEDVNKLSEVCEELGFGIILLPGRTPTERFLGNIVSAQTRDDLLAVIVGAELNYSPPTDESPYFFNMLRLTNIGAAVMTKNDGVIRGNLIATLALLGLMVTLLLLVIATIIVPLALRTHFGIKSNVRAETRWSGVIYFTLIGAGFMLTEIALIQRLTVLLSHPIYALGILLFTLIASTGIGSLVSDRLPLTRSPWAYLYPIVTAGCLIGLRFLLEVILATMIAAPVLLKIGVSVSVIFPVGLLMGLFFPTGMRLTRSVALDETPWYWALNGIFGVLCSALAVFISIYIGISANFYIAATCYGAVLIAQVGLQRVKARRFEVV
jgi:spermidine synthase